MAYKPFPLLLGILVLAFISVTLLVEFAVPGSLNSPIIAGISGTTGCVGGSSVIFQPNIVAFGETVTAQFSGMSNCVGKIVFLRHQTASDLQLSCSCILEDGNQCSCSFAAPSDLCQFSNFYAQLDKNDNGNYNDPGESNLAQLYTSQKC